MKNNSVSWVEDPNLKIRILILGLLGFLLTIKSDRYFPLPENTPEPVFQVILIPYTLVFLAGFFLFLKPEIIGNKFKIPDRISSVRLTALIAIVFEINVFVLLFLQNRWYASFGYRLNVHCAIVLFLAIGVVLTFIFIRNRSPDFMFYAALASYTGTYLISIASFPLHPQRSDMLPLLVSGGEYFLESMSPYGYHNIPHHLVFTYLPGLWLTYLPAVILHVDPRFINLLCVLASVLVIVFLAKNGGNHAYLLVSVFLLIPYLQYRHEIYIGVLFFILSVVYALYSRSHWLAGSAVFGYALAAYQFCWTIFPFAVVSIFRSTDIRRAALSSIIAIAVALAMILPFFLDNPYAFIAGIYGHWDYENIFTINLSYLVSRFIPWDLLIVVQGSVILVLLAFALKKMDPRDLWAWMAGSLLLVILLNRVIEVYFYLLVLILLVIHGITVDKGYYRDMITNNEILPGDS